jgi:predicted AAA+ superfamily ATPase
MKNRKIVDYVRQQSQKPGGRIIVFTGARQTGKTTLARILFPSYAFLSIEDPVLRVQYARLTAAQWKELYPYAILDEVQKEPRLIESIKSVYDQWPEPRYALLGSSQLLLLEKVKESLAGRCTIVDLFPLTVPELETEGWDDPVPDSLFQRCLLNPLGVPSLLPNFLLDKRQAIKQKAWDHYVRFGGYPALTAPDLSDEDRFSWLAQYVRTYLERDIRDLAVFRDLEPFIKLQRYMALQTGTVQNNSTTARQVGVSAKTVQRYIQYLEMSYQALILPAWYRNEGKRLVKAPKVHWLDNGVLQAVVQKRAGLTGLEFESLVVAELYKQSRCSFIDARFYYIRTVDGREVDLLIELGEGYLAFEIKISDRISAVDARHLKGLQAFLDKPLLRSFIVSNDPETKEVAPGITAVHAAYFLG